MVVATVILGGSPAHNRAVRTKPEKKQFYRRGIAVRSKRDGRWLRGSSSTSTNNWASRRPTPRRWRLSLPMLSTQRRGRSYRRNRGDDARRSGVRPQRRAHLWRKLLPSGEKLAER
ncbi:unnamed protein product [Ectocarpus sp. 12 AP-2014]